MTDHTVSPPAPVPPPATKAALRRACLARRDAMTTGERAAAAAALLAAMPELPPGAVVAGYWPIRSELDCRPLLDHLAAAGHVLALPAVAPDRTTLLFRRYTPGMALEAASFGLSVPPDTAGAVDPDVLLLPLAGFDAAGNRLGYGAGHYDRALARLDAVTRRLAIGLAFAAQQVDAVPAEPHDRKLDAILTERGFFDCAGTGRWKGPA